MKLYVKIVSGNEYRLSWDNIKDRCDKNGQKIEYASPSHREEDGWYQVEREPQLDEYPEYDEKTGCIVIKKRKKSVEVLEAERLARIKQRLKNELSDIVFQNRDNPTALAQAFCDRAKQIDAETP